MKAEKIAEHLYVLLGAVGSLEPDEETVKHHVGIVADAIAERPAEGMIDLGVGSIVQLYDAKNKPYTVIELGSHISDMPDGQRLRVYAVEHDREEADGS